MTEKRTAMKHNQEERRSLKKPLENMNSFLYKLWSLVNDETLTAIHWSEDGEKVVIDNPTKFTAKVLTSCDKKIFKTKNISSFIRQLNLYGFRRVKESSAKLPIIFKHDSFKRGCGDLLVEVKRKKPLPNKVLHPSLPITAPQKRHKTTETQGQEPRISNSRYPYLPNSLNYSYFNTNNLTRKTVHMPFVTPFAVNHGPTFINVGSSSTIFGKQRGLEQPRISGNDAENLTTQHPSAENQDFPTLHETSEVPYYPWQRRGYYTPPEPGTTAGNSSYGNDMAYSQVMMQNQANSQVMMQNQANYPSAYLNMFPAVTHATNYRNYGDASESMSYTELPTGPLNSLVTFSHHTPAQIERNTHNNHTTSQTIPEKPLKFKTEASTACNPSVYEEPTADINNSYFSDDGHEQKKTVVNGKAFSSFSA